MIAEKALLGTFLKENGLLNDAMVKPEHFVEGRHKLLMNMMKTIHNQGKTVDIVTLAMNGDPNRFGGLSYVQELMSYANPLKFEEYEDLVLEQWKQREKRNILTLALQEDWETDKVSSALAEINQGRINDHKSISEEMAVMFEMPWCEEKQASGVLTGLSQLDAYTNGFQDGEVTIIAARPSMGKTDVMLHLAKQAGWQGYLPILFSLEMPAKSITKRLIASTGKYNRGKMRDPYRLLTEAQKNYWPAVLGELNKTNIQILDEAAQTIPMMRTKIRKMMHEHQEKKPIVFIDYLGLIKANEHYGGNMNLQITEISQNLKRMAKDFGIPIVCLAQLNRSVEQRKDKRPMMSDIRDSGSVEQDADVIIFLYREKYYDRRANDATLELIIAKNRNGAIGTAEAMYNENTGVIQDGYNQRIIS